ncbi:MULTISPECIES: glycosyltransferase [unclassified Nocardioides]|uniref:glycosyltransferase n=1 Tax=unclassified Nocardioides TaxID=2615069 RepID=UPI00360CEE70
MTVVITTTGRPTLEHAVASALAQVGTIVEVVVVVSGDDELLQDVRTRLAPQVVVIGTGKPCNANVARNLGIGAATGHYIALLDDDDYWQPEKVRVQVAALEAAALPARTICATAYRVEGRYDDEVWPVRPPRAGEQMGDYLFTKDSVRRLPVGFQTSTIMAARSAFLACRFDEALSIHQDWDWLVRAVDVEGFQVAFVDRPLSVYRYGRSGSATRRTQWQQSRDWATSGDAPLSPRSRGDFLLTVTLSFASTQASIVQMAGLVRLALVGGRPGLPALLLALPRIARGFIRRALERTRGERSS